MVFSTSTSDSGDHVVLAFKHYIALLLLRYCVVINLAESYNYLGFWISSSVTILNF